MKIQLESSAKTEQLHIVVPKAWKKKLQDLRRFRVKTLSELLREAVQEYLERSGDLQKKA